MMIAYAMVATTGVNLGLDRYIFPVRDDPFTGKMAERRFEQAETQRRADLEYLREYSDDNREHLTERLEKEALEIRLYVTENYLDKNTPIPSPECLSRIGRLEERNDRHEFQIDAIRTKLGECCYSRKTEFNALEAK